MHCLPDTAFSLHCDALNCQNDLAKSLWIARKWQACWWGGEGVIWEVGSVSGGVGTLSISIDLSHASALTSTISHLDAKIFLSKFDDQFQIWYFFWKESCRLFISIGTDTPSRISICVTLRPEFAIVLLKRPRRRRFKYSTLGSSFRPLFYETRIYGPSQEHWTARDIKGSLH